MAFNSNMRGTFAVLVGVVLSMGLPLLVVASAGTQDFSNLLSLSVLSSWTLTIWVSVSISLATMRGRDKYIQLTFYVFTYIFMCFAALVQNYVQSYPWGGVYDESVIVYANLIIFLGIISFEAGYILRVPKARVIAGYLVSVLGKPISKRRAMVCGFTAIFLSLLILYFLGGIDTLFIPRAERYQLMNEAAGGKLSTVGILGALVRVPIYVCFLAMLLLFWDARKHHRQTKVLGGWAAILGALTLAVNNPISTPRFYFGTIVLSVTFVLFGWRKCAFGLYALCLIAGFILIFPLMDLYRSTFDVNIFNQLRGIGVSNLATNGDFDAFQQLLNCIQYVEVHGHTWGAQILGAMFYWVPRAIWVTKPEPTGVLVAANAGYEYLNLSMPLWGESYIDGGMPLTILMFFSGGIVARRLDNFMSLFAKNTLLALVIYIFAAYQLILLRGSLLGVVGYVVPFLGMALLIGGRVRRGNVKTDVENPGRRWSEGIIRPAVGQRPSNG